MTHYRHGIMYRRSRQNSLINCFRPSIQTSAALISYNMKALLDQMNSNQLFFHSAHVHPSPSFPGRTQENLLTQLLRKKLNPSDEDWIKEGHEFIANITKSYNGSPEACDTHLLKGTLAQLWDWAGPAANNVAKDVLLSMNESSDEDIDEDDDDDKERSARMEGIETHPITQSKKLATASKLTLEETFRFMSTGNF